MEQIVGFPTRDNNILDLAYCSISSSYKAFKLPPLGSSDHHAVLLKPTYQTQHKLRKPSIKSRKLWTDDSIDQIKTELATTNWDLFADGGVDQAAELTTDYLCYLIETKIPTKNIKVYANNRPWLKGLKGLINEKSSVAKTGDKSELKSIQDKIKKATKKAKREYKEQTLDKMATDIRSAWRGIKTMSNLNDQSTKVDEIVTNRDNQLQFAMDLNEFYCRFERNEPAMPEIPPEAISPEFEYQEVLKALNKCKPGKAAGPDSIPTNFLKQCSREIAEVMTPLFNMCLRAGKIPQIWKKSNVTPLPKCKQPKEMKDYRPIALTSTVMKVFEHVIKERLLHACESKMDENQFAYRARRSTTDACTAMDHIIRKHVDKAGNYCRVLFIDFTSAFNTISPPLLINKLTTLGVPSNLTSLIMSFLSDRQQAVRVGNQYSDYVTTNTGCPQGCVLSPLLFSLYTNDLQSSFNHVKVLKYADDMAFIGLLNHSKPHLSDGYFEFIDHFVSWCSEQHLLVNSLKTKEMVLNFSRSITSDSIVSSNPVFINGVQISNVSSFTYLGTVFNDRLKWHDNSEAIMKKLRQRKYAFYRFCSFSPTEQQKQHFLRSLVLPVFMYNSVIWFNSCTQDERDVFVTFFSKLGFSSDITL